jgi:hypothetical protein
MSDGIMARVVGGWTEGRLEKAGVKGQSQQLPEAVWAEEYASGQVVEPPYDLEALAGLYEGNSTHKACVDAKTTNIVGLGYRFVAAGTRVLTPSPSLKLRGTGRPALPCGEAAAGEGENGEGDHGLPPMAILERASGAGEGDGETLTPSPSPMRPQTVAGRGGAETTEDGGKRLPTPQPLPKGRGAGGGGEDRGGG